tara:strand:- start:470 stop:1642 length:1173 start_codon:yes stop_codon:yes gene_type:complete
MTRIIKICLVFVVMLFLIVVASSLLLPKYLSNWKNPVIARMNLEFNAVIDYQDLDFKWLTINDFSINPILTFDQFSMELFPQEDEGLKANAVEIEIDLLASLKSRSTRIKSLLIDGSEIWITHSPENGLMFDQIPITKLLFLSHPGARRPLLTLKNVKARSFDLKTLQEQFGFQSFIVGKKSEFDLNLIWAEIPRRMEIINGEGSVKINIDDGQITVLERVPGKIFGLFSLAKLPKRLLMDFSDVTKKGFSFKKVTADFQFNKGSAYTCDLVIKGTTADILIIGATDLIGRTFNQLAIVQPAVSDMLPMGGAMLGGPAVAASVFIFTKLLRKPLKEAGVNYYSINGSWENPIIELIPTSEVDLSFFDDCQDYLSETIESQNALNNSVEIN